MAYQTNMVDVRLSRSIAPPCFEVGREAARLLAVIHETISRKFVLSLSDLQALPGGSLADVGIRGSMFNHNFEFEIAPERFEIVAKRIQTSADLDVIRQSAELLHEAVRKAFPQIKFGRSNITLNGWLMKVPDTDPPSAASLLAKLAPQSKMELFGGEDQTYGSIVKVRNASQGYVAALTLDESMAAGYELYFRVSLDVEPSSPIFELPLLGAATEAILQRWFRYVGVPTIDNSAGATSG